MVGQATRVAQDVPTSSVREVRDMAKMNKKHQLASQEATADPPPKLKRKPYEQRRLM